jgi:MFS family permease
MSNDTNIHRYLDETFADLPRTPENQDLKEEIRGNLAARVAELEATGVKPDAAAAKAIKELGDISDLVDNTSDDPVETMTPRNRTDAAMRLMVLNRIKPDPAYVVRTVLLAILLATGVTFLTVGAILGAHHVADTWLVLGMPTEAVASGAFVGLIVADALTRETSQHYRMPSRRALGFGLAAFVGLTGLGFVGTWFANPQLWFLILGCVLAFASLLAFIVLGVTQTNRMKSWVKELNKLYAIGDRFSEDPVSAARFGLYTVIIWLIAIVVFIVLSITIGFLWSWIALLAGLVVFFLVLARMLFPAEKRESRK